jgi:hypothetical protein
MLPTRPRKFGLGFCGILAATCTSLPGMVRGCTSSWLYPVERWFALLSQRQIKRGSHYSVRELESAILQLQFIDVHNQPPKPFVWTNGADAILNSIARFASRTLVAYGVNNM